MSKKLAFPIVAEALVRGYLAPRLAMDASVDLRPVTATLTPPTKKGAFKVDAEKFKVALDAALKPGKDGKPKLAQDADVADVQEVLSQLEELAPEIADMVVGGSQEDPAADPNSPVAPGNPDAPLDPNDRADTDGADPDEAAAADPAEGSAPLDKVLDFLKDKLSPEDMQALQAIVEGAMDSKSQKDGAAGNDTKISKAAMDAAIETARKTAVTEVMTRMREVRTAEQAVLPYVGQIKTAMDSADDVYKFALKQLGVKVDGVHASALPHILAAQPLPGSKPSRANVAQVAKDSATGLKSRFGDTASRLKSA